MEEAQRLLYGAVAAAMDCDRRLDELAIVPDGQLAALGARAAARLAPRNSVPWPDMRRYLSI